jgi:hypothetical protein
MTERDEYLLDESTVRVEVHTNATPIKKMRIVHIPTGYVVIGKGRIELSLRERLMGRLEGMIFADENHERVMGVVK